MDYYSLYADTDPRFGELEAPVWIRAGEHLIERGGHWPKQPRFQLLVGEMPDFAYCWEVQLFSAGLRDCLDGFQTPIDFVEWREANVEVAGEDLTFWSLHFTAGVDVLDPSRSIYAGSDFVVKPVIDFSKAAGHHLFTYDPRTVKVWVSDAVRHAVMAGGFTGCSFSLASS